MKQTAVEWLIENLISEPYSEQDFEHNFQCWEQAKEMEKEQIIDFAYVIADDLACGVLSKKAIEDRYNETFKSDGETLDTDTTL